MQVNDPDLHLKCHSSMNVSHTFCKCKSVTWFLRRRGVDCNLFNTPKNFRNRNVLRYTTLCSQYVANAKKPYALNPVCSSYITRLPWHRHISKIKSLLSHPEVSCIHLCTLFLWDDLYLPKHHSNFRLYLNSTNPELWARHLLPSSSKVTI